MIFYSLSECTNEIKMIGGHRNRTQDLAVKRQLRKPPDHHSGYLYLALASVAARAGGGQNSIGRCQALLTIECGGVAQGSNGRASNFLFPPTFLDIDIVASGALKK